MKKKAKLMVAIIILMIICIYLFMTPVGALRLKIALTGHPIKAITFTIADKPNHMFIDDNQIGYSLENPPFEKDTQSELINWVVTKHGIFYTADYYGWG